MYPISGSAPLRVTLYTKEEVHAAINTLKKKNTTQGFFCTRILWMYLMNKQKKQKLTKIVGYQKEKQRNKLREMLAKEEKKIQRIRTATRCEWSRCVQHEGNVWPHGIFVC